MAVNWQSDCDGGQGSAASFVTHVFVYVDGQLVATRDHQVVEGDESWWSFSVPLDLSGTHTVRVTDQTAEGTKEYVVATTTLECEVATTTTTTIPETTAATTIPVTTVPPATLPATTVPVSVTAASIPVVTAAGSTVAQSPATTAQVLAETITAAPATLPATGAASGPLVDVGLGFVVAGAAAIFAARRRISRA